ncbi:hypothetical protein ACQEU8_03830 [Streptomyces sp. CA-250714]
MLQQPVQGLSSSSERAAATQDEQLRLRQRAAAARLSPAVHHPSQHMERSRQDGNRFHPYQKPAQQPTADQSRRGRRK